MSKSQKRPVGARISALLVAGALALLLSVPAASQTDAGWIDPEYASAGVTTVTVPNVSPRPTCTTEEVTGQPNRKKALIAWTAPSELIEPTDPFDKMRYEIRITNTTAIPNTKKSVFQTQTSYTFDGGLFSGDTGWPNPPVTLSVQVFVVIPNSAQTAAVWESLNAPATPVRYSYVSAGRYSYVCDGA